MPKGPQGQTFSPFGLYRCYSDTMAMVRYEKNTMVLPKAHYEESGFKPDYDDLPTEAEWEAEIDAQRP